MAICRRLEGLPLAIELAAARLRTLTARELAQRLDRPLSTLIGGPRGAPERQRALRATVEWSVRLLADPERGRRSSGSPCSTMASISSAAEVVCDDLAGASGIDELVTTLLDSSLLRRSDDGGVESLPHARGHPPVRAGARGRTGRTRRRRSSGTLRCFASRAASLGDGPRGRRRDRVDPGGRTRAGELPSGGGVVARSRATGGAAAPARRHAGGHTDAAVRVGLHASRACRGSQAPDASAGERARGTWHRLVEVDFGPTEANA